MSNIAIIYTSKYGSAKQYAQWLSEETGADLFEGSVVNIKDLAAYEKIVYGGGIHAGGLEGIEILKKINKKYPGKVLSAFAVGINVDSEETQKEFREINMVKKLKDMPCFFLNGKYEPEKVTGFDGKIMGFVKKTIEKKADRTDSEEKLLRALIEGVNMIEKEEIQPLVELLSE